MFTLQQTAPGGVLSSLQAKLKWWLTPRATSRDEAFRERSIRGLSLIVTSVSIITIVYFAASGIRNTEFLVLTLFGISVAGLIAILFGRINLAAWLLMLAPFGTAVMLLIVTGYWAPGGAMLLFVTMVVGAVVLPRSRTLILPIGAITTYAIVALSASVNGIKSPLPLDHPFGNPIRAMITVTLIMVMFSGIGYYLIHEFEKRSEELRDLIHTLEDRVADRTRDLELAADVSRQITTILNLQELLSAVVERTKAGFKLYHVSIFLYDADAERLVLEAGAGRVGELMKAEGWHFDLATRQGLVTTAAHERSAVLINDVRQEARHRDNPYLPETRSELALPMLIGDRLVGILDLQSEALNRFGADDVRVMTALAQQIAIAVQNAQLYAQQVHVAEELRTVDNMKSQFLSSMSHELRTPLNAILNFTEFVSMGLLGPVNERQTDALDKALDSGRHLLSLINDVLDMTKIEAGMMKLLVEPNIDLHAELTPVIAAAQTLLKDKPVQLVLDIDANLPRIMGDKRRIRQILLNLLSNAAKFTDEGSITLSVKNEGSEVLFAVIDTGPGIALEDQGIIFEPFQQTETGIRHAGGTGLGLPITKRLIEAHHGRIWVESEPGGGTAFYVVIPTHLQDLDTQTGEGRDVKSV